MPQLTSPAYVDSVFHEASYTGLVWLSGAISNHETIRYGEPTYGLSDPLFVFVEGLNWFAQAVRSGVVTYFEATSPERQAAMYAGLQRMNAPTGFVKQYRMGMEHHDDAAAMARLDQWHDENDEKNNAFLWLLAGENRAAIEPLLP